MADTNTYYSCQCIYLYTGYTACKICSQWIKHAANAETKDEPVIIGKRWFSNRYYNTNQKITLTKFDYA